MLHSFNDNGIEGTGPIASLIFDTAGNLYGTTTDGGIHGCGTAFELTPMEGGGWAATVLHSFNLNGTDGAFPVAGLNLDGAGNLYGTTLGGGDIYSFGTVFEITR